MTHLDTQLLMLKNEVAEMAKLVISQLKKTQEALVGFDKELAKIVVDNEKMVNFLELKIDRNCENIIALFNPVAVDLRFVLAVLKINTNLERTGDNANRIAQFVINAEKYFDPDLLTTTRILPMHQNAVEMLSDVLIAFENEDTKLARGVFMKDELLDEINRQANPSIADFIKNHPDKTDQGLYILAAIMKLERVGDQCKNMAEEIIFYVEAKVLKHLENKQRE
jgi:phosphate transport system protein